jgi:hypothetical protein
MNVVFYVTDVLHRHASRLFTKSWISDTDVGVGRQPIVGIARQPVRYEPKRIAPVARSSPAPMTRITIHRCPDLG